MYLLQLFWVVSLVASCGSAKTSTGGKSDGTGNNGSGSDYPSAMALKTSDDLPECSDDNANQLVYVIDEGSFYVCDEEWAEIDVQYNELPESIWRHPKTGVKWVHIAPGLDFEDVQCSEGYHIPSRDEVKDAISMGIITHFYPDVDGIWHDSFTVSGVTYPPRILTPGPPSPSGSGFCVED